MQFTLFCRDFDLVAKYALPRLRAAQTSRSQAPHRILGPGPTHRWIYHIQPVDILLLNVSLYGSQKYIITYVDFIPTISLNILHPACNCFPFEYIVTWLSQIYHHLHVNIYPPPFKYIFRAIKIYNHLVITDLIYIKGGAKKGPFK